MIVARGIDPQHSILVSIALRASSSFACPAPFCFFRSWPPLGCHLRSFTSAWLAFSLEALPEATAFHGFLCLPNRRRDLP
jgi:hypothetical protein